MAEVIKILAEANNDAAVEAIDVSALIPGAPGIFAAGEARPCNHDRRLAQHCRHRLCPLVELEAEMILVRRGRLLVAAGGLRRLGRTHAFVPDGAGRHPAVSDRGPAAAAAAPAAAATVQLALGAFPGRPARRHHGPRPGQPMAVGGAL